MTNLFTAEIQNMSTISSTVLAYFLNPSEEKYHAYLHTQEDNFTAFKETLTEEEQAKVAEQRQVFDAKVKKLKEIDPKFVEADLTIAFSKWSTSIGFNMAPCQDKVALVEYFNKAVVEMEDTERVLERDAAAKTACEEKDFEAWLANQNILFRRVLPEGHDYRPILKKEFDKWCACKWKTDDNREFLSYMLNFEYGPSGMKNFPVMNTVFKLVELGTPEAWLCISSHDLVSMVSLAKGLPEHNKTKEEMLELIKEDDEEPVSSPQGAYGLPSGSVVADIFAELEHDLAGLPDPAASPQGGSTTSGSAAGLADPAASPQGVGTTSGSAADILAELEHDLDGDLSVAEEEGEEAGAVPSAADADRIQRDFLKKQLEQLEAKIDLKDADKTNAKLEPIFRKLAQSKKRSFQRSSDWRKPLGKLPHTPAAKRFKTGCKKIISETMVAEKVVIDARKKARADLAGLVNEYFGSN